MVGARWGRGVAGGTLGPTAPGRASASPASARLVASICVVGVLLSLLASWASAQVERSTEQRLLEVQSRQAASVLASAVESIEAPLESALDVDRISGGGVAGARAVTLLLGEDVGAEATFVTASLWRSDAGVPERTAALGARPGLAPGGPAMRRLLVRALAADTTVVHRVEVGGRTRIGYALADDRTGAVVHAERAIPADGRAPVDRDSAYSGINYAIYLGTDLRPSAMTTTNVEPGSLPLAGAVTHRVTVPFGDTVLTLVTSPRERLSSPLGRRLPLLLLVGGLLLTGVAALVAGTLTRARRTAEADTATIRSLYERVDSLYDDQRELFVGLQRALLPNADPHIPHVEVAAEYVAGAIGIDIGGDWYSVLRVDDDRFAFVVGDVSGRGVDAVAEMARARFTLRAYLSEGHGPAEALAMCSRQFDVLADGHIITVLVGLGDQRTGELVMANAGHPPPLLASSGSTSFLPTVVGPPLGLGATTYEETTAVLPEGSTLLCYTDGLVERRSEDIEDGLDRLRRTVESSVGMPLRDLLAHVLAVLGDDRAPDDTAVLVLRRGAPASAAGTDVPTVAVHGDGAAGGGVQDGGGSEDPGRQPPATDRLAPARPSATAG